MDLVEEVIDAIGGIKAVQERYGYTSPMGVYVWRSRGLPTKHLIDIHHATGIPLERLQPKGAATPKN